MSLLAWILGGLAAATALFVGAELATRRLLRARGAYYVWKPYFRMHQEIDLETLPALEPLARFEVNGDGERGDILPRDRRGLYRVLVAGGSAAECYFLDQPSSWPGVIQRHLNEAEALGRLGARRAHVGNVARSLVATEQVHRMLERVLPRLGQLEALLLMVGASDIVHWLERRTPPVLPEGELDASHMFAVHPEGFGWGARTLALRQVASRLKGRWLRPVERHRERGRRLQRLRRMRAEARVVLDTVPDPAPMLDHFERWLRRAVELGQRHARRVVVVRQPWFDKQHTPEERAALWNFAVGRPQVEPTDTYFSHAVVSRLMAQVDARASAVASELGVEQVDLMAVLERSLATYYDYLHFTPRGAAAVGAEIARQLLAGATGTTSAKDGAPRRAHREPAR